MITFDEFMAVARRRFPGRLERMEKAIDYTMSERDTLLYGRDKAYEALEVLAKRLEAAEAERDALRQDADNWKAINMLWHFPGKTLEQVLQMRLAELKEQTNG